MTNFEKIKQMSVEEMAKILDVIGEECGCIMPKIYNCSDCILCEWCNKKLSSKEWLESEADNE